MIDLSNFFQGISYMSGKVGEGALLVEHNWAVGEMEKIKIERNLISPKVGVDEAFFQKLEDIIKQLGYASSK